MNKSSSKSHPAPSHETVTADNLDYTTFEQLHLSPESLEAVKAKGFEEPSPIQRAAIPILLDGEKDVIGQARTGTGKTAAFALPILDIVTPGKGFLQALILAPTRELAIQISEETNSLRGKRKHAIIPLYGGQFIEQQINRLKREGADIAVGTPGRILDLMRRKVLDLSQIKFAVLDEADEMLNMGFLEDIEQIMSAMPKEKRTLMFSATMPAPMLKIAENSMRDYVLVNTKADLQTNIETDQIYFEVRREDKIEALSRIVDMKSEIYAMVFCRTKLDADELNEKMNLRGYHCEVLHGDIAQAQRTRVIDRFRNKKFNILIATDVAARGIDVNHLTHVINYSFPQETETYIHRIGRTGRAGKTGSAITFVTPGEFRKLMLLKKKINVDIRKESLPDVNAVIQCKKEKIASRIGKVIENERHTDYLDFAGALLQDTPPAEVVASLLRIAYKTELVPESYTQISGREMNERAGNVRRSGETRYCLSLGKKDGLSPKDILNKLYDVAQIKKSRIGRIEIYDDCSIIHIPFEDAEKLQYALQSHPDLMQQLKVADDSFNPDSSPVNRRARAKRSIQRASDVSSEFRGKVVRRSKGGSPSRGSKYSDNRRSSGNRSDFKSNSRRKKS